MKMRIFILALACFSISMSSAKPPTKEENSPFLEHEQKKTKARKADKKREYAYRFIVYIANKKIARVLTNLQNIKRTTGLDFAAIDTYKRALASRESALESNPKEAVALDKIANIYEYIRAYSTTPKLTLFPAQNGGMFLKIFIKPAQHSVHFCNRLRRTLFVTEADSYSPRQFELKKQEIFERWQPLLVRLPESPLLDLSDKEQEDDAKKPMIPAGLDAPLPQE